MTRLSLPALLAGAVLAATIALPARAALVTYDIGLTVDSGPLAGQQFGGQFSFDDALPTTDVFGDTAYAVTAFGFDFGGQHFGLGDLAPGSALSWVLPALGGPAGLDGVFDRFSFVPGGGFDPFFTYDFGQGRAGTGELAFTPRGTVPEPASLALAASALLALAAVRGRRRR